MSEPQLLDPRRSAAAHATRAIGTQRQGVLVGLVAVLPLLGAGCIGGSLATSTGPRVRGLWSVAAEQHAHVGEEVLFDFVLTRPMDRRPLDPVGIADYCVLQIGEARRIAKPDFDGHFRFSHTLTDQSAGSRIKAIATAYRAVGHQDLAAIAADSAALDGAVDDVDQKQAADSVRLVIYQAKIDLTIPKTASPLDPASGRIQIRKADGSVTSVYQDRPNRRGFTITGAADGGYTISYLPRGDELNPTGTTDIEFTVYDQNARRHALSQKLATP